MGCRALAAFFLSTFLFVSISNAASSVDYVIPPPKAVTEGFGYFIVTTETAVQLLGNITAEDEHTARVLREELVGRSPRSGRSHGSIVLKKLGTWAEYAGTASLAKDPGYEGYVLEISKDVGVVATAISARGLYYAGQTLLQLVQKTDSQHQLQALTMTDWPDIKNRMVLYDLRFNTMNLEYGKRWIRTLSRLKINQFMIFMSGDYQYKQYPFIASDEKLTPEKLAILKKYAREHHVELIPQIESFGHAEGVLNHDQFQEMRMGPGNTYAYSPCTEKTYSLLGELYRELATEFDQSELFHVGGDEVWGFDQDERCHSMIATLGEPGLYSAHIQRLAQLVRPLNRKMAIWSDMILHHPESAIGIPRDTVIFDWHYEKFDEFPSLKFFKEQGFKNIYASPSAHGFKDAYPWNPYTFRNVNGFTKAALREGVDSVCVTVWEMHRGGNAENYLYGVGFSGQVMWNSQVDELKDFNRRFAAFWFDNRDERAIAHVDKLFWFPWRTTGSSVVMDKDNEGHLHDSFMAGDSLYLGFGDFGGFLRDRASDDAVKLRAQAVKLEQNVAVSEQSSSWLARSSSENKMTLDSHKLASEVFRHIARKMKALSTLSIDYKSAHSQMDSAQAATAIVRARADLQDLKKDFRKIRKHMQLAIDVRNSDPYEMVWIQETRDSLDRYLELLQKTNAGIRKSGAIPAPEEIGL